MNVAVVLKMREQFAPPKSVFQAALPISTLDETFR